LAPFAHPTKDDYCFANQARALGLVGTERFWYAEATGRFSSTALMSFGPWTFGSLIGYKLFGPVLMVLLFLALWWLIFEVRPPNVGRAAAALAALALEAVFLGTMASPAEGIYWYNGAVVFTLGAVLAITTVAAAARAQAGPRRSAWRWSIVAGAAAVMAGGSNEVVMSSLAIVLLVVTFLAWRFRLAGWRAWLVPLVMTAIAGAVDVAAPGNYRRAEATHGLANAFGSVVGSAMFTVASILEWLSSAPVIIGAVAIVICGMEVSSRVAADAPWRRTPWPVPLIVAACGIWGSLFLTHWASGLPFGPAPKRVLNVVELYFLLAAGAGAFMIGVQLPRAGAASPDLLARARRWSLAASALLLLGSRNVREGYIDLVFGRASGYDRELDARYALLASAAERQNPVIVPALSERPGSLFFDDITVDPAGWSNVCVAEYWRVPAVGVAPSR
jgi:hypothetical protein